MMPQMMPRGPRGPMPAYGGRGNYPMPAYATAGQVSSSTGSPWQSCDTGVVRISRPLFACCQRVFVPFASRSRHADGVWCGAAVASIFNVNNAKSSERIVEGGR